MIKILRIVLPIIVLVLAGYSLISGNHETMPYMMFFMGALFFVMGIVEIKESRKTMGIISIIVSIFILYVSVEGFLLK